MNMKISMTDVVFMTPHLRGRCLGITKLKGMYFRLSEEITSKNSTQFATINGQNEIYEETAERDGLEGLIWKSSKEGSVCCDLVDFHDLPPN